MALGNNLLASKIAICKRRGNLFKKAAELSTLSGARVAIITISKNRKVSMFPNSNTVIRRYLKGKGTLKPTSDNRLMNLGKNKGCEVAKKEAVEEDEVETKALKNKEVAEEGVHIC
ncbi:hypothetical protein PTKIN_Ptkin14bG0216300 [Pterospermum kingtungense]